MTEITREGAVYQRLTSDGREICVYPQIFNTKLIIGKPGLDWYDSNWCYETPGQAIMAAEEWEPEKEADPEGWFRHPPTGRRRPNGDPEKEYVAF